MEDLVQRAWYPAEVLDLVDGNYYVKYQNQEVECKVPSQRLRMLSNKTRSSMKLKLWWTTKLKCLLLCSLDVRMVFGSSHYSGELILFRSLFELR